MNPVMMYQLTQANQIPKDPGLRTFLAPLTGKEDLVTMEGQNWKRWRSIFNPGFSGNRINTLVPGMVEKVQVFRNMLAEKAASGELFLLEKLTLNLTIDIIGGPSCRWWHQFCRKEMLTVLSTLGTMISTARPSTTI
jgi:cytochrome P450